ncbi:hypothetical protein Naga_100684g3 [Nannochloropsis gaditana]|uniref:Uncharacterized protein n=1 Tax=Nannochloropsis gaditana TaxID=72520 RepID=W7TM91_9STRA|nr:hypothetical protein Naga_100684g3 [Nannochloropsis gaditana]
MHMSDNNPCANYSSVWSPRAQQDALAASASFVKITNIDRKHRVEDHTLVVAHGGKQQVICAFQAHYPPDHHIEPHLDP